MAKLRGYLEQSFRTKIFKGLKQWDTSRISAASYNRLRKVLNSSQFEITTELDEYDLAPTVYWWSVAPIHDSAEAVSARDLQVGDERARMQAVLDNLDMPYDADEVLGLVKDYTAARGILAPADEPAEVSIRRLRDGDQEGEPEFVTEPYFGDEDVNVIEKMAYEIADLQVANVELTARNRVLQELLRDVGENLDIILQPMEGGLTIIGVATFTRDMIRLALAKMEAAK